MKFNITGNADGKPLMLIHGMAATADNCYRKILPYLTDYCVILCEVNGHYEKSSYISAECCCDEIEKYITDNFNGEIYGLSGFSMGGSIAVKLMGRGIIKIRKVLLDAPFCVKIGALAPLFTALFSIGADRMSKGKVIPAFLIEAIMGKGNTSITDMFYRDMKKETAESVCNDIYRFEIPEGLRNFEGKVMFWCGSNEKYPQKSLKLLRTYLPEIENEEFKNMGHGQFLNECFEEYGTKMLDFMK